MTTSNLIHFKGLVQDRNETPKQRKIRKQKEFLAKYELYKMSVRGYSCPTYWYRFV